MFLAELVLPGWAGMLSAHTFLLTAVLFYRQKGAYRFSAASMLGQYATTILIWARSYVYAEHHDLYHAFVLADRALAWLHLPAEGAAEVAREAGVSGLIASAWLARLPPNVHVLLTSGDGADGRMEVNDWAEAATGRRRSTAKDLLVCDAFVANASTDCTVLKRLAMRTTCERIAERRRQGVLR